MRTTVTLEQDLADKLKEYAHRKRTSFKVVLNTVLRRRLVALATAPSPRRRFAVEPHSSRLQPGVDPGRLNQRVDRLEAEDFVRETRAGR